MSVLLNEFDRQLQFGRIAETKISRWIIKRGNLLLPVYDIECTTGKGPRMFGDGKEFISPDLLIINKHKKPLWVEAKHKTVFSWHRKTKKWVTGIDLRHYEHYQEISRETSIPVWILFLHKQSTPSKIDLKFDTCPPKCPVGLFGGILHELIDRENHRDCRHGSTGMVYWAHGSLEKFADLEELSESSLE